MNELNEHILELSSKSSVVQESFQSLKSLNSAGKRFVAAEAEVKQRAPSIKSKMSSERHSQEFE